MKLITDAWNSADPYEYFMGRWSTLMAREFLDWLDVPADQSWLDIGCGTGALSESIMLHSAPSVLTSVDPSEMFLAQATKRVSGNGNFLVGSASSIPINSNSVDVIVSGLALNFFPSREDALVEMKRVAKGGSVISAYVWDYAGRMDMLRYFWDAVIKLDPSSQHLDEGIRFPICNPENLKVLFDHAGLFEVDTVSLDIVTHFTSFEDYWRPFLGVQGPAPGYVASLPEKKKLQLRAHVYKTLPIRPDGSISLTGGAFAVRGTVVQ